MAAYRMERLADSIEFSRLKKRKREQNPIKNVCTINDRTDVFSSPLKLWVLILYLQIRYGKMRGKIV